MTNEVTRAGGGADDGSRILKAVEALAISPADAAALAARYRAKHDRLRPGASEREAVEAASRAIVRRYAKLAAAAGGVTALSGVIPGVGTMAAMVGGGLVDATATMKLQADMVMCLAALAGWDLTSEDARHASYLIAAFGSLERVGVEATTQLASKAGVRMLQQYLRGAALVAVKQAFRKVGLTFTRVALEKAFPFGVGVALSASTNYALTAYVGRTATQWFRLDAEMASDGRDEGEGD